MCDRPPVLSRKLQQLHRAFDSLTDIAISELRWIGETLKEIDYDDRFCIANADCLAETLALIDIVLVTRLMYLRFSSRN